MATKISIEDRFSCSPQKLYDLLSDDKFDDELMQALKMQKSKQSEEKTSDGILYKIRLTSPEDIPAIARKFTGEHLSYVETRNWLHSKLSNTWLIQPEVKGTTVEAKGTTTIVASGDGCVRKTEGTISVNLPLIGKKIEEMVLKTITDNFNKNAEFCRNYLKEHA